MSSMKKTPIGQLNQMRSTTKANTEMFRYIDEKNGEPQGFMKWVELDKRARNRPGYCGGVKL